MAAKKSGGLAGWMAGWLAGWRVEGVADHEGLLTATAGATRMRPDLGVTPCDAKHNPGTSRQLGGQRRCCGTGDGVQNTRQRQNLLRVSAAAILFTLSN